MESPHFVNKNREHKLLLLIDKYSSCLGVLVSDLGVKYLFFEDIHTLQSIKKKHCIKATLTQGITSITSLWGEKLYTIYCCLWMTTSSNSAKLLWVD